MDAKTELLKAVALALREEEDRTNSALEDQDQRIDAAIASLNEEIIAASEIATLSAETIEDLSARVASGFDSALSEECATRLVRNEIEKTLGARFEEFREIESESKKAISGALQSAQQAIAALGESITTKLEERVTADYVATTVGLEINKAQSKLDEQYRDLLNAVEQSGESVVTRAHEESEAAASAAATEAAEQSVALIQEHFLRMSMWKRDGPPYNRLAVVQHNGGLWQAAEETNEEPGKGRIWRLLLSGIKEIGIALEERELNITVELTTGQRIVAAVDSPIPTFLDTWVPDEKYRKLDSVIDDGHRWLARSDEPQGKPATSDDWALFAMRGPAGKKGKQGEPGSQGRDGDSPSISSVVREVMKEFDSPNGIPIVRARGLWKYGETYRRGDLVDFGDSLLLAAETHKADVSPTNELGGRWIMLFHAPASGGGGGGGAPSGLPDPSGAADGSVLTVFNGAYVITG